MTIKECYLALGGDYEDTLSRFRNEERIHKYILKFLDDQSFATLQNALEQGDMKEAFRAAHTLKGLAQNLGFQSLSKSSSDITEALRSEQLSEAMIFFKQVKEDYQITMHAIEKYQEMNG